MKSTTAIVAAALVLGTSLTAGAQDLREFYEGKTIRWIVGGGPGGGYDQYARLISPEVEKATGATVIVEYRPEGSGMTAIGQVADGDAEGLDIMLIKGAPAAMGQIIEAPAIRFELQDLAFLGRVAAEPWVLLVGKDSGYTSLQDMVDASAAGKTLSFSGLGRADGPTDAAAVICEAMSLNCKMVVGYKGSRETSLAALRGDVTGTALTDRSALEFSSDGSMIPVAIVGRERSALMPDVPTVFEAVEVPQDKEFWIDFRARVDDFGRVLITNSDTPEERIEALRAMFRDILTDPEFVSGAAERGLPIDFATGAEVAETIDTIFTDLPEDRRKAVREVVMSKYF